MEIQYYIPRYYTTSAMIIQGLLPNESPDLTVAWIMMGPPLVSVMVPYLITCNTLPHKAMVLAEEEAGKQAPFLSDGISGRPA